MDKATHWTKQEAKQAFHNARSLRSIGFYSFSQNFMVMHFPFSFTKLEIGDRIMRMQLYNGDLWVQAKK